MKWMSIDAAEVVDNFEVVRCILGLYDPYGGALLLFSPASVNT